MRKEIKMRERREEWKNETLGERERERERERDREGRESENRKRKRES